MNNALILPIAAAALIGLVWWYRRSRENDRFAEVMALRAKTATLCSRAHLIDGANHIPVALSLESQQISYQNSDLDATLDIAQIDEVEYGSDLVTGGIADGAVLRLRAHGRAIEFVLDVTAAEQWSHKLPPHRMNEPGIVHAV